MNTEKITSFESSMIRLRDIMMSIMFEQVVEIRKKHPVTAEDMTNIVTNYLAQTGLDEQTHRLLKELCLQIFKCTQGSLTKKRDMTF